MITTDQINITQRSTDAGNLEVHAKVELHAVTTIPKHEKDTRGAREQAQAMCRHRIWGMVYGELDPLIGELGTILMRNVQPSEQARAQELLEKARNLIGMK